MKQTINFRQFHDAFEKMGRGTQFSYEGRKALFEYLEQIEQETGEETEIDVIALCCEYEELTISEAISNHNFDDFSELENHTTVIYIDDLNNTRKFDIELDGDKRIIIHQF